MESVGVGVVVHSQFSPLLQYWFSPKETAGGVPVEPNFRSHLSVVLSRSCIVLAPDKVVESPSFSWYEPARCLERLKELPRVEGGFVDV